MEADPVDEDEEEDDEPLEELDDPVGELDDETPVDVFEVAVVFETEDVVLVVDEVTSRK